MPPEVDHRGRADGGLDPAQRVRFLNLLGEISEASVVILSTHIVADVEALWRRSAIVKRGHILLKAEDVYFSVMEGHCGRQSVASETGAGGAS